MAHIFEKEFAPQPKDDFYLQDCEEGDTVWTTAHGKRSVSVIGGQSGPTSIFLAGTIEPGDQVAYSSPHFHPVKETTWKPVFYRQELEEKIRKQQFDLDDFLEQFKQIRKMGSFSQILGMLPGIDKKMLESVDTEENEKKMLHIEAIIQSMTQEERRKPSIIGASRKVRISKGSGTRVQDVNQLLKQFEQMQKMMKQLSGGRQAKMLKRLRKRK
jgi:hypothetical protein